MIVQFMAVRVLGRLLRTDMARAWSHSSIWHHIHDLCDYRGEALVFKTSALSSLACVVRRLVSFDGDRSVLLNTSRIIFMCGVDTHANRKKFDVRHRVKKCNQDGVARMPFTAHVRQNGTMGRCVCRSILTQYPRQTAPHVEL